MGLKTQDIIIYVQNPVKQGEGINAFVTYQINVETDLSHFSRRQFSSIRRFSDFSWLREQLVNDYPGIIVPPLPEKATMTIGKFKDDFLESRRRSLEKFLWRIAAHQVLKRSEPFKVFLEENEESFTRAKEARNEGKGGIMQWFSSVSQSIVTTFSNTEREKTPEDIQFEETEHYINSLSNQVTSVHKHAHALVRQRREASTALWEFGLAFTLLGQSESNSLGNALSAVGHRADNMSVITGEQADNELTKFEEPVKEYVQLMGAVKDALHKRSEKLANYHSALSDLESRQASLESTRGKPGKEEKIVQLEDDIRLAQSRVDQAQQELSNISETVREEIQRFKQEKIVDFKRMIHDFVQLQIDFAKKMEEGWSSVLPEIESIDVDAVVESSSPAAPLVKEGIGDTI